MAATIQHPDKLGRIINDNDWVCYPRHNSLSFGKVVRQTQKSVMIHSIDEPWRSDYRKYPYEVIRIEDSPEVTLYMLKLQTK